MDEPGTSKDQNKTSSGHKGKYQRNQKASERYKAYSGSKREGQGFADLRKKKTAREYLKFLKQEQKKNGNADTNQKPPLKLYELLNRSGRKPTKPHLFSKAEKIGEEKRKQRQEEREKCLKEKEAKETALKAYKAKKKERFLKLCKKTKKGQPVMKNQMEVLLEKIMKHKGMETDSGNSKG